MGNWQLMLEKEKFRVQAADQSKSMVQIGPVLDMARLESNYN